MIIKRWDGSAFVEEHPKTKAQLIYNDANTATIFDANDKIKVAYLPNSVFDSLTIAGTMASNFHLANLTVQAISQATAANRSPVGYYFVSSGTYTLTANEESVAAPFTATDGLAYYTQIIPGDGGVEVNDGTLTVESGDWFVLTKLTGTGVGSDQYRATWAVINNTYEDATTSLKGIVQLSDATTYAGLSGGDVITEGILKTVIDNASFAAGNHVHGNISNNGSITTNTAAATGQHLVITSAGDLIQQSAITLGTTTTTYLRNDGSWGTPVGTTYAKATATTLGLVELFDATVQSTAANAVTTTASRTYGVQLDSSDRMVVNVPWVDTNTTYGVATATTLGLIELGSATQQTTAANAVTSTASRTYALQLNSDNQGVINVPWTDTVYSLPQATTSALGGVKLGVAAAAATVQGASTTAGRFYHVGAQADGTMYVNVPWTDTNTTYGVATDTALGLVELFNNTDQAVAANAVSSTAGRTYGLQLNSANQGVINVPWTDTVATAATGGGLTATSNAFSMVNPFFAQADAPASPVTGTIWFDL